jgi:hypothetical protein
MELGIQARIENFLYCFLNSAICASQKGFAASYGLATVSYPMALGLVCNVDDLNFLSALFPLYTSFGCSLSLHIDTAQQMTSFCIGFPQRLASFLALPKDMLTARLSLMSQFGLAKLVDLVRARCSAQQSGLLSLSPSCPSRLPQTVTGGPFGTLRSLDASLASHI